jgi:hypothetical protein
LRGSNQAERGKGRREWFRIQSIITLRIGRERGEERKGEVGGGGGKRGEVKGVGEEEEEKGGRKREGYLREAKGRVDKAIWKQTMKRKGVRGWKSQSLLR